MKLKDWEMHKDARVKGLCVYPHESIHQKVVIHLFSGQWAGGWVEQRRKYTGLAHCFGMGRGDVVTGSYARNSIVVPPHGGGALHIEVKLPREILAGIRDRTSTALPCAYGGELSVMASHADKPGWLDLRVERHGARDSGWPGDISIPIKDLS